MTKGGAATRPTGVQISRRLFLVVLVATMGAQHAAAKPHRRHPVSRQETIPDQNPTPVEPTPAQKALAQVEAERAALMRKRAEQARALRATQAAARAAQQQAMQSSARASAFGTRTRRAQTALDATNAQVTALTAQIADLQTRRDTITRSIARENRALQSVLPIAQRMSTAPDAALLATPGTASEGVEALSILGGFTHLIRQKADTLQANAAELRTTTDTLGARQAALDVLIRKQTRIRDFDAARTTVAAHQEITAEQNARDAGRAVTRAMQDAADLSLEIDVIARQEAQARTQLEAEARALARAHRMADARRASSKAHALGSTGTGVSSGAGHAPVAGHVIIAWGQNTEAGPATGITYAAATGTTVNAPCAGRIEFAGPFRSFGQMLILDCGRDYRFVLSGLGALRVSVGTAVGRAAPLGSMSDASRQLFVQLRHGPQTINPAPFL